MNVTVTIKNGSSQTHHLTGRAAELVAWLVKIGEGITESGKGKLQVDYSGTSITKSFLQIEEGRGK